MKQYFKLMVLALICFLSALPMSAQRRAVNGSVSDDKGEPIAGASVLVSGTTRGVSTDLDGNFSIDAAADETLVISFIGFEDARVKASSTSLKVVLNPDSELLEETVVVGYGVQKKATLTGAVSAVTNREITVTKNENVVNMLSGKIPGVRISQNSAQPGEFDNSIDIRGMGEPLIVVDGIPRDKAYFSRMDSNEIESISVLKDASAAVYGVRAANGVILITTKRGAGESGKFDITLSANYGWQQFLYVPETASATDHMLLMNEKRWNAFDQNYYVKADPAYRWDEIFAYSSTGNAGTNWSDVLFNNNVPQMQYNVSMDGGSDKIKYFFNIGYMDQQGAYSTGSLNYDRWNFRSNVDAQITKRLKASVQLSGYIDEKNQPFTDIWAVYKKAWTYKPTANPFVEGTDLPGYSTEFLESENPYAAINSDLTGYRQEKRANLNGSLSLQYDIPGVKGLNIKGFYSYDYYTTNNTEYKRQYELYSLNADGSYASYTRNADSYLRRSTDPNYGTLMQLSINYANKFGNHSVSAMALYEESYNSWDNFYAQRVMALDGEYLIYGEDDEQVGSMSGAGDISRKAVIGKVNYDYKSRYMIDLSFRVDGSSRYPQAGRWGFFPAVSAGWRISEEPWVKGPAGNVLTNLKLRASYGIMGDDGSAGTYPNTVVAYNINKDQIGWFYGDGYMAGVAASAIPNLYLTWYTAKTANVGVDFDLWHGMLGGTVEVFNRTRDGLLATSSAVVPDIVGASLPQENLESDRTFGWEISLSHRHRIGDWSWWVNGQISATKSRWVYKMNSLAGNSMDNWYRTDVSGRNKDIWFAIQEAGRFTSYDQIRYHGTTGTNLGQGTLPGDYYYEDWNEDGIVNDGDRHPVANYNLPVFNYGLTLGAEWKGIDISANFQGAAGVYNMYSEVFTEVGPFNGGAALNIYKDRWHTVNPTDDPWNPNTQWVEGYYPATQHSFNTGTTGIKNTSYLRLKTLEIGYTLPKKWMNKINVKSLRVYANGYNLLTFSGLKYIDPERPGARGGSNTNNGSDSVLFYNYPVNRVFNIGLTIKF